VESFAVTVNLAAIANRHEINFSARQIETINHPIIADAQSVLVRTSHAIMLESREPQTHRINLSLDMRLNLRWQAGKVVVKLA
jgi:hypothetical protein